MFQTLQDADREARQLVDRWTADVALTGWIPGSAFFLTPADTAMIHKVASWAAGTALTGWIPGSAFFLIAADTAMIRQVASVYRVSVFDMDNLLSTLTGAIASAVAGGIIIEAVGLIPVVGWAAKRAAGAAKTKVIGDAVIRYFRERSPLPDTK